MSDIIKCAKCGNNFTKANTEYCDDCRPGVRLKKKREYARKKREEAGLPTFGAEIVCGACQATTPWINNGQKYCPECSAAEKARHAAIRRERHKGKYPRAIENPEVVRARQKAWVAANPDKVMAARLRHDEVRLNSPRWRMENAIRCGVRRGVGLGKKRDKKTFDLLGYTPDQLREHLERQFLPGMGWENYGDWHIDHRLPLSSFNYTEPSGPEFSAAWAITNLQPMWANENLKKSAKILYLI